MCGGLLRVIGTCIAIALPLVAGAQDIGGEIRSLHQILDNLFEEMLPLCGDLIDVGRAVAAFGATWYIAVRVWRHIANAEPVEVFPLLRPFAIGGVLLLFPQTVALVNSVLHITVVGTQTMVDNSNEAVERLFEEKEKAMRETPRWRMLVGDNGMGDRDLWMETYNPDQVGDEGWLDRMSNSFMFTMDKAYYNFKNWIKEAIALVLQILYEAAALCINTLRTFHLLILAILGPFVLGLSVFDGLTHTLNVFIARYINYYLWLPVANILGALLGTIQEGMIKMDTSQIIQTGDSFFNTSDIGYIIFMLIGIVGYTTVPSIAEFIVHVGSGGAMRDAATGLFGRSLSTINVMGRGGGFGGGGGSRGGAGMAADVHGDSHSQMSRGMAGSATSSGYFQDKVQG